MFIFVVLEEWFYCLSEKEKGINRFKKKEIGMCFVIKRLVWVIKCKCYLVLILSYFI